jgi:ribosome-binding protein aMBF1 (putative translation factor)
MTAKKAKIDGRRGGRKPGLGKTLRTKPRPRKEEPVLLLGRFGRYLAMRRELAGFSIREFAKKAGMPFSNVFQMEALRKNPRLTELEKLAKAYDETLLKFLGPLLDPDATLRGDPAPEHHVAVQ